MLSFFQVFSVHLTSGDQEGPILNNFGKAHKSKYISELHASQNNTFPCKFLIIHQIRRCNHLEGNKVNSDKITYNSEIFIINFLIYKGKCISLIAT